ncbi:MAG: 3-dehydroquinate synthase, partial [Pseudomonadales bacterium]
GHAIEAFQQYKDWLHGEAVGAGMVMATELSMRMGNISEQDYLRTKKLIAAARLPTEPPKNIPSNDFLHLMWLYKKVLNGQLRLVLLKSLGEAVVTSEFPVDKLKTVLPA